MAFSRRSASTAQLGWRTADLRFTPRMLQTMRPLTSALCALALVGGATPAALVPAAAQAQTSDPAAQAVQRFDDTLLATMKQGRSLGFRGRYTELEPAVKEIFDLPLMIRFAVGTSWGTLSPADQSALLTAFTRYSTSTWAKNFSSYSGQHFQVNKVDTRGLDKLVHTQLVSPSDAVDLAYRMRQTTSGQWKVIDVYFNGSISQLSQQRTDYASTLQGGGAPALVKKINDLSDKAAAG